jgi:hypothetical protein
VTLTVNKATPTITWLQPAPIVSGTPLSSTQLDASLSWIVGGTSVSVAGTLTYSQPPKTVLKASAQPQALTVTFAPTDTADYNTATDSVSLQVGYATTVTVSLSKTSITTAQSVTITGTVKPTAKHGTPTGTVTFYGDNGVTLGTGTLNSAGQASLTLPGNSPLLTTGTNTITWSYSGDPTYIPNPATGKSTTSVKLTVTAATAPKKTAVTVKKVSQPVASATAKPSASLSSTKDRGNDAALLALLDE